MLAPERWARVRGLLEAVVELPPPERRPYLSDACPDDPAVRSEVESLLRAHEAAGTFLDPIPSPDSDTGLAAPQEPALPAGSCLGHFEIVAELGAGGMGRVYRARDTDLNRDVAIKVLAPAYANDADRLARFAREARVLASLNHPNIAQIHGLQSSGVVTAIVMELVEGETLADRIARGPIDLSEALHIARQIAEALEAAHEQGVIHRDLKPGNIQVRGDGTVKVVDFGLAKTVRQKSDDAENWMDSSSLSSSRDMVLGTAAYMSPEQARQKPVDRRADIWAFGCILLEMLTGQPAFAAHTLPEVTSRIINGEPDFQALPASTPPAIRRLLRRCLEKDARGRLDSAAAARLEIDEAERESSAVVSNGGSIRQYSAWPALWLLFAALGALLVTMTVLGRARPSDHARPLMITAIPVDRLELGQPGVHFSLAPSGSTVVYASFAGESRTLFRRDLDRLDPEPIVGTEGASDVFFSEDGRQIGFETRSELWSASLDGGTPRLLQSNHPLRGGTWVDGDRIVVGLVGSGLWMTSATGGGSRQLTIPAEGERHELPQLLPGGRGVLFTILATKTPPRAAVVLLGTGESRDLFEGSGARYVNSGHIVFGRQGRLWAVAFDLDSLQTGGVARPVRDDVLWSAASYPQFAVGGDALAYVRTSQTSTTLGRSVLTLVNRQGAAEILPLPPDNYMLSALSPAGDRLVVQVGAGRDLWTYDFSRGTFTRLTSDRVVALSAPTWTPDGSRIVFTTWFDGEVGLGWVPADGSGAVEALVRGIGMRSFERAHPALLPDGSGVIMTGLAPAAALEDLLIVRLTGEPRLEPLFQAPGVERNAAIAPTGRFIAYNSDESGRPEVYVRPLPEVHARRWQVSTEGGAGPRWTRGGRELVYRDAQGRVMSVTVRGDGIDGVDFAKPESLFTFGAGTGDGLNPEFDVSSDGERFLFSDDPPAPGNASAALVLIQNWVDELKRLVPPGP